MRLPDDLQVLNEVLAQVGPDIEDGLRLPILVIIVVQIVEGEQIINVIARCGMAAGCI